MFHLLSVEPTIHYYIEKSFVFEWKQKISGNKKNIIVY